MKERAAHHIIRAPIGGGSKKKKEKVSKENDVRIYHEKREKKIRRQTGDQLSFDLLLFNFCNGCTCPDLSLGPNTMIRKRGV